MNMAKSGKGQNHGDPQAANKLERTIKNTIIMLGWTRRQFLKGLSMAGIGCLAKYQSIAFLPHLGSVTPAGFAQSALKPLFEEVPSAATGLIWRHENGRSADYFLPETT